MRKYKEIKPTQEERAVSKTKKKRFLELLEQTGGAKSAVAKSAGVPRATLYLWMETDPDFKKAVLEVETAAPDTILDSLYIKARGGDFKAQKYYLEHRHPDFKRKSEDKKEIYIYHHVTGGRRDKDRDRGPDLSEILTGAALDPRLLPPKDQEKTEKDDENKKV